ncbi:MAG: hypothetical protein D0531_11155 [Methylococcales bacterium]|nr:MAG: hypothetical protein D0531_11155 [Methylococcales bacterium]
MSLNNLLNSAKFSPKSLKGSNAWIGHLPFAAWVINEVTPKVFVELGTYAGNSYFSFCQSVTEHGLSTKCYAVDTWQGDEHSGHYSDDIFNQVNSYHQAHYADFSNLLRMTFDEAAAYFSDASIDLLHIDGLHTYEAVAHDFQTWLPKLAPGAIVMFHDTNVRERNFGVWKLWEELKTNYPNHLEFIHSHGLGVLKINDTSDSNNISWLQPDTEEQKQFISYFTSLGSRQLDRYDLNLVKCQFDELTKQLTNTDLKVSAQASQIDAQAIQLDAKTTQIDAQAIQLDAKTTQIDAQATQIDAQERQLQNIIAERDEALRHNETLDQIIMERETTISQLLSSNSWRLTKPIRFLSRALRGEFNPAISPHRATPYVLFILKGDFVGLISRLSLRKKMLATNKKDRAIATIIANSARNPDQLAWGIMATPHTLFIAYLIADRLQSHGWQVEIFTESPKHFQYDYYIVICPQMFTKLPPGEKRIAFQMEQSVSSRWFTSTYFAMLNNSLAVLEYALVNVDFMATKGVAFPHVHYLPVGAAKKYGSTASAVEKTYDILFYGDSLSSLRRRKMLDALSEHFTVRVINDIFGNEIQELIKQARLVINLHYYENALLEMPRIQECLSLGIPVISESAQDQQDYPELIGVVHFFEQGSIAAMLSAVKEALEKPVLPETITESVKLSEQRFKFMFDRFLIALGFLPASYAKQLTLTLPNTVTRVALSLPETIGRRRLFESEKPVNCHVFDGIRRSPGWVGCGLSYVALSQFALKQGINNITVMEDDVILPANFESNIAIINEFLAARPAQWDVFAGVIAALHSDVEIVSVDVFKDITFVTINKMTSTVFNIYSEKVLHLLASWDPENLDAEFNTIDRFLEQQADLRVVVTLPFFVGHREEVHSTLWGFQNDTYNDMIDNSELLLENKVATYLDSLSNTRPLETTVSSLL